MNNNITSNPGYEFIRRMDDSHYFIMAVLNLNAERMRLILQCQDLDNPADTAEAEALAVAYGLAGLPPPTGVFTMLGNRIPNPPRRRIYSIVPQSEKRTEVHNWGVRWDNVNGLVGYDGSVRQDGDHNRIRDVGFLVNIPTAGVSEAEPETRTLLNRIQRLRTDLQAARQNVQTARQNEQTAVQARAAAEQALTAEQNALQAANQRIADLQQDLQAARADRDAARAERDSNRAGDPRNLRNDMDRQRD